MKNLTATICLTVALLFGCTGVCKSADFQKGYAAHESGDFATALREWKPLAKQGDSSAQYILNYFMADKNFQKWLLPTQILLQIPDYPSRRGWRIFTSSSRRTS